MTDSKTYFALVVEDSDDIAGVTTLLLQTMGLETHHAKNGALALDFLSQRTPDIMLLDIGMPGMSGWETLDAMKARYGDLTFPVIVLTAFGDPANKLIGKLQTPVVRYLTKPFEPTVLMNTVRQALSL